MLLRFSVSNHLSFLETQELSLVASSLKDREDGLIPCPMAPGGWVLPAVLIYGPNASGKSNLVDALNFMRSMVLFSHSRGEPGGGVPRRAFQLDPASTAAPTRCEMDFVLNGVRHRYGFEASDDAFRSEWLYDCPHARARLLFERDEHGYRFGRALKGQNRAISDLTRSNSLFLSAAAQNGHAQLARVFVYFSTFSGTDILDIRGNEVSNVLHNGVVDERVIEFLKSINSGVVDYRRIRTSRDAENKEIAIEVGGDENFSRETTAIELGHYSRTGKVIYFDLDRESAGTRRLLFALDICFRALNGQGKFMLDELDAHIHTQAAEAFLALFCSRDSNPKGAQLIATTHDTNLLNSPLLRRDQIWFTEKDDVGATRLYPLTDIRNSQGRGY